MMENNINGHNQNRNNVNRHHEQGNVVQSKTSIPNDVIDERWENQHLKYGWGKFKPQYVPFSFPLTLNAPITTAADDIYKYLFIVFIVLALLFICQ